MRTFCRALSIPVAAIALLACNASGETQGTSLVQPTPSPTTPDSSGAPNTTDTAPATAAPTTATTTTAAGTTAVPTTAVPTTAAPTTVAPTTALDPNAPVRITLTVGTDTGPDRRDTVRVGQIVELAVTNPSDDDEFHMHHFDLGGGSAVPAGQTATFSFVADTAGEFELESHATHSVLMTLVVVA